ncbi:MAG TPA: acyloxyacyl hydrolase [Albitalea sp.]|uniref:acyloxyacyl hydrolase n=1 Tax=Piscinibacter sp. TaxID=1903157 RepID=UPI002ED59E42
MRITAASMHLSKTSPGLRAVALLALLSAWSVGRADEPVAGPSAEIPHRSFASALKPRGFFTQFGVADEVTAGTAGAIWNVHFDPLSPRWSVYLEASVSRWQSRDAHPSEHGVLTQVALIPVFRYRLDEGRSPWFVEGGVGATATSSIYRHGKTRFSTSFNFGDHVGVGYSFGEASRNEIALRVEHFSNAGIKHPNPGKNFLELRYVRHFE